MKGLGRFKGKVVDHVAVPEDSRVVLDHVQLREADYSNRKLVQFSAIGSRLDKCRFDNARIDDASFGSGREMSEYVDCSFDGVRFSHGGGYARFTRCSFRGVDLSNWICFGTEIVDCTFTGRIARCIFNGAVPLEKRAFLGRIVNEFRGNDFSELNLVDVTFRTGINLAQQRLPSGPEYLYLPDASAAVAKARSLLPSREKQHPQWYTAAVALLDALEKTVEGGQRQMLLKMDDYYSTPALSDDAVDAIFSLLRAESTRRPT